METAAEGNKHRIIKSMDTGEMNVRNDRVLNPSETQDWYIAQAAAHWLREHGYFVKWDNENGCYRVVEEGADRKDDKAHPTEFRTVQAAYSRAFRLIAGEK